jgi:SAM-dependent methyltransferase
VPVTITSERPVPAADSNFAKYSAVYDLLYRDKDYASEADYVARTLRAMVPQARGLLELGSGTGRHGRLLANRDFIVHGIERSPYMVKLANAASSPEQGCGRFTCEVGDIRAIALGRGFDAVIALFHVISYQTTDDDLHATFAGAARHLEPGGIFLFDVWHGPAVLTQRPERRVKRVADERIDVVRTARAELDIAQKTVKVVYDMEYRDRRSGKVTSFSENHVMRYLFPHDIESLAKQSGMEIVNSEEFMTGLPPSPSTWSVFYALQRLGLP